MKIRPVILCGGSGNRLWPNLKKHQAKQFIDFGGWTLLGKTLERIKGSLFDSPIISTNSKYLKEIKNHLKKHKIKKYKIVLEPAKKNTGPAILATALICSDSKELVENIMESGESVLNKHELIEVIKTNTEPGCYEGSEHNS